MKSFLGKKLNIVLCMLMISLTCVSCAEKEPEPLIVVDTQPDAVTYNLVAADKGEVVLSQNLSCNYVQTKQQEVSFTSGGKIVDKVYVREGDKVNVGDLLVGLELGDIEERIADLQYTIDRNTLKLGYLDKAEEFDYTNSYYQYVYDSKMEEEDVKKWEERDEQIAQNYQYQREDLEDTLEFDKKELDKLKSEFANSTIRATMSGVVYSIEKNLEGSTAKKGEVIMTIVDNANGLFETEIPGLTEFISDGDVLSLSVAYGTGKGNYEVVPYNISTWGEKQLFSILEAPENSTLEVGTGGTIKACVDRRENVLRVPTSAIYEADGKYYVYMLDEKNMRQVNFVEVGLYGDSYVEITAGLSDGDMVVKR